MPADWCRETPHKDALACNACCVVSIPISLYLCDKFTLNDRYTFLDIYLSLSPVY